MKWLRILPTHTVANRFKTLIFPFYRSFIFVGRAQSAKAWRGSPRYSSVLQNSEWNGMDGRPDLPLNRAVVEILEELPEQFLDDSRGSHDSHPSRRAWCPRSKPVCRQF